MHSRGGWVQGGQVTCPHPHSPGGTGDTEAAPGQTHLALNPGLTGDERPVQETGAAVTLNLAPVTLLTGSCATPCPFRPRWPFSSSRMSARICHRDILPPGSLSGMTSSETLPTTQSIPSLPSHSLSSPATPRFTESVAPTPSRNEPISWCLGSLPASPTHARSVGVGPCFSCSLMCPWPGQRGAEYIFIGRTSMGTESTASEDCSDLT